MPPLQNVFTQSGVDTLEGRIRALTPQTQPEWGRMSVAQMLAHCNVAYELEYTDEHPRPGAMVRLILRLGAAHFDGRQNKSFGKLSLAEWNTLFSKHLDHHLTQFGV